MSRRFELAAVVAAASIAAVYLFNLHAIFNFYAKYFELTANDAHTQAEAQSQSVAEAVAEAMSGGTHTLGRRTGAHTRRLVPVHNRN